MRMLLSTKCTNSITKPCLSCENNTLEEKRKAVIDTLWKNLREALDMDNSNFQAASDLFNYLPYC